jgi:hypothetical protein
LSKERKNNYLFVYVLLYMGKGKSEEEGMDE